MNNAISNKWAAYHIVQMVSDTLFTNGTLPELVLSTDLNSLNLLIVDT